ncbi:hypothetical protein LIER_33819 [Lithospermum erythrorhizon]|uniref:Uncharacterized protein n=1 Tax=Lithospermum erythrorhizon TaxID=34254 RepID=A0AAV3RXR0_LITER
MWISITGFYFACLLAGVTPTIEFFQTSFSQCTQNDDFFYFVVKPDTKGFCEAFPSRVDPESWRPFFFFVSGESLPTDVNSSFTPTGSPLGPLRCRTPNAAWAVVVSSSSEDYEVTGPSPSAPKDPSASRKTIGSPYSNPRRAQSQRRSDKAPVSQGLWDLITAPPAGGSSISKKSSSYPSHEEGVALHLYKRLLTSFEEASQSSSRVSQLEQELRALRREKAREEGALKRCLKNLAGEHDALKERYAASVRRTDSKRSQLDGVRAERYSA